MKYYIVEHVYYKQKFLVRADGEVDAKTKVARSIERVKGERVKITDLEVYRLPSLSLGDDVAWI